MQLSSRTPHCATLDLTSCLCAGLTHYGQHVVPASTRTTKPVYKPSICLEDSEQTSFSHTSARKTLSSANSILMSLWLVTWNIILFAVQPWRRALIFEYWDTITATSLPARSIINTFKLAPLKIFMQFILDCSVLPEVISAEQKYGKVILNLLFKATRTYCYSMYRERMKRLDMWSL